MELYHTTKQIGYFSTLPKYTDLIKERDRLIEELREFEQNEMTGDRSGEEWLMDPDPETRYQCSLDYLAELCAYA